MIAMPARGENRRQEPAGDRENREGLRVLQNREGSREGGQDDEQRKGRPWRQHRVDSQTGKDRQVEYSNGPTLQCQGVTRTPGPKSPTQHQQSDAPEGDAGEPELDRDMRMLGGVPPSLAPCTGTFMPMRWIANTESCCGAE